MKNRTKIGSILLLGGLMLGLSSLFYLKGKRSLKYHKEITTSWSSEKLWKWLKQAFIDSEKVSEWPNELERLKAKKFAEGELVTSRYKFGKKEYKYKYRIIEIEEGRKFVYQACKKHPLEGGGVIEIIPKGNGAVLKWDMEYYYDKIGPTVIYIDRVFLKSFFNRIERVLNEKDEKK